MGLLEKRTINSEEPSLSLGRISQTTDVRPRVLLSHQLTISQAQKGYLKLLFQSYC
jgi:hypothetical protein